jgi:hypothetical protein
MLQTLLAGRESSESPTHHPSRRGCCDSTENPPLTQNPLMLRRSLLGCLCLSLPAVAQDSSPIPKLADEDLSPPQFVLPGSEAELRRTLGRPNKTIEAQSGWLLKYPGLTVWTNGREILGATVTSRARSTRRGLRVADKESKVLELYGSPTSTYTNLSNGTRDLFYQVERTEALIITVKSARVLRIYAGAIYD